MNIVINYGSAVSYPCKKKIGFDAFYNLGVIRRDKGDIDSAIESYKKALAIQPNSIITLSNLLFTSSFVKIEDKEENFNLAKRYGEVVSMAAGSPFEHNISSSPKRLRIGFVSGDLRNHPVGYFLESFLSLSDQSQLEFYAYPTATKEDDLTARIRPFFSKWTPVNGKNDETAARMIHDDGAKHSPPGDR